MGFFYNAGSRSKSKKTSIVSSTFLQKVGCKACPANTKYKAKKTKPIGASSPSIYVLTMSPRGKHMLSYLEDEGFTDKDVRFGFVTACACSLSDGEYSIASKACRGYATKDIEEAAPVIIMAVGDAYKWIIGKQKGASWQWSGRVCAATIGEHTCWVIPVEDPDVLASNDKTAKDNLHMLGVRIRESLREVMESGIPDSPPVPTPATVFSKVKVFDKGTDAQAHEVITWLNKVAASGCAIGFDLETAATPTHPSSIATVMRPMAPDARILTAAVSNGKETIAFPVRWSKAGKWKDKVTVTAIEKAMIACLKASSGVIVHNASFEVSWIPHFYGDELRRGIKWDDTMAQAYALDERRGMLSLEVLSVQHFGFNLKAVSNIDTAKLESYPLTKVLTYNAGDAKWTRKIFFRQKAFIKHHGLEKVYKHLMNTAPTVAGIQNKGVLVDTRTLRAFDRRYSKEQAEVEELIFSSKEIKKFERTTGKRFEPTNNHHVLTLFKDVLKRKEVTVDRKGKTITTTDESALEAIPLEIAKLVVQHRKVSKLLGTYVHGKQTLIFPDGRFHSSFNHLLVSTGRLSSDSPNMQNFPKRKDKHIRNQVIAPEGYVLLAADYGQIEARVIAVASEDEYFLDALWEGMDIHMVWTERLLELHPATYDRIVEDYELDGSDEAKVKKALRGDMKNGWVFPQFYGSSFINCARGLKIPERIAERMASEFWDTFSGVKAWQDKTMRFYKKHGFVETLTGRRRHGPIYKGEIINTPIQGTASDIVVDAMNRLDKAGLCPNINIHDDLTQEVKESELEVTAKKIAKIMCTPGFDFITCPLVVEMETAKRWGELTAYKEFHSNKDFGHTR